MRLGLACHNFPPHPGGLEVIVEALAGGFAQDHEVTLVTSAWAKRTGWAQEASGKVLRLPALHFSERLGVPYPMPLGRHALSAYRGLRQADLIHAHGALYATTTLAVAARRKGVPLVLTEHVGFVPYRSRVLNAIQSSAWRLVGDAVVARAAALVVYNSRVQQWLSQRYPQARIEFIPNGVDAARFAPPEPGERETARALFGLPAGETLALFVGRASTKKNLEAVLAFPNPGYRLVVCGGARELPRPTINLGVIPHARMPLLYRACDFMIHAATGEGFPVAIQEAMACGLAVAVLWDAGYRGAVAREAVAAANDLESLARVSQRLATDATHRKAVGAEGFQHARDHYSWRRTVERYLDLFDGLVEAS